MGGIMTTVDEVELQRRVAILKRLRENLLSQRTKFFQYLSVLEKQEFDIINEDTDKLEAHIEMEQSIVREIFAFQKVIHPLEELYHSAYPAREPEIPELKKSLENLKLQVLARNKRNQGLLREHMVQIRQKIIELRSNTALKSVFSTEPTPTLIDITT